MKQAERKCRDAEREGEGERKAEGESEESAQGEEGGLTGRKYQGTKFNFRHPLNTH